MGLVRLYSLNLALPPKIKDNDLFKHSKYSLSLYLHIYYLLNSKKVKDYNNKKTLYKFA